jgi:hypothetical protein
MQCSCLKLKSSWLHLVYILGINSYLIFFGYWRLFPDGTFMSDSCKAEDLFEELLFLHMTVYAVFLHLVMINLLLSSNVVHSCITIILLVFWKDHTVDRIFVTYRNFFAHEYTVITDENFPSMINCHLHSCLTTFLLVFSKNHTVTNRTSFSFSLIWPFREERQLHYCIFSEVLFVLIGGAELFSFPQTLDFLVRRRSWEQVLLYCIPLSPTRVVCIKYIFFICWVSSFV